MHVGCRYDIMRVTFDRGWLTGCGTYGFEDALNSPEPTWKASVLFKSKADPIWIEDGSRNALVGSGIRLQGGAEVRAQELWSCVSFFFYSWGHFPLTRSIWSWSWRPRSHPSEAWQPQPRIGVLSNCPLWPLSAFSHRLPQHVPLRLTKHFAMSFECL